MIEFGSEYLQRASNIKLTAYTTESGRKRHLNIPAMEAHFSSMIQLYMLDAEEERHQEISASAITSENNMFCLNWLVERAWRGV